MPPGNIRLTEDEFIARVRILLQQTPGDVQLASLKMQKTQLEAMQKGPGDIDA